MKKLFVVVFICAVTVISLTGCEKQTGTSRPAGSPTGQEHPKSEQPKTEHPK